MNLSGRGRLPLTFLAAGLLLAACGGAQAVTADEPLMVAAAADLRPAFRDLGEHFEEATGERVTFVFGSSGHLAQQIIEGAPMDLFASADAAFVDQVLEAGRGVAGTRATYGTGRIAIWAPAAAWGGWGGLDEVAADPAVGTVAIAHPEHAPYGQAAVEALQATGVWAAVQPRLVYGENVADTQRLAATGNADVAVTALSLALAADEAGGGEWKLVPAEAHDPLRQDLVVVRGAPDRTALARQFVAHVTSARGREVMRRHGFLPPGERPPESWEE